MPRRGHRLEPQELEEGAHEDVDPRREDIGPQEAVPVGAGALGQAVEEAHRLLQQELEPSGPVPEPGDHEDPQSQRKNGQDARHGKGGDEARVHVLEAEEAHLRGGVEHRVPHGLLDRAMLPAAGEEGPGEKQQRGTAKHRKPRRPLLFVHVSDPFLLCYGT